MNGIIDQDCDAQQNRSIYTEITSLNLETKKSTAPENKATLKVKFQKHFRHLSSFMRVQNQNIRVFLAELLGSLIFISFGLASVAQFKFFKSDDGHYRSAFLSVNLAFGFGITIGILVVGKVSGAHLNPSVSFAMFLMKRLSFIQFLIYSCAQFIGSFLAALLVFIVYYDSLKNFKPGMYSIETAGIFATYPHGDLSVLCGFFNQIFGTFFLILVILALTDEKNSRVSFGTQAISIGMTISAIGLAFGHNSGFAINPTRDFGPRFFTFVMGWGVQVFTSGKYFFWIPIIGPLV
jgi:aquaporin-3